MTAAKPTIVLDARKVDDFGIGTYVTGLVEGFARVDLPGRLVLAGGESARTLAGRRGLGFAPLSAAGYSIHEQLALPRLAVRLGAALWHFPHYVTPLAGSGSMVVTIHDVIHLERPQDRSLLVRPYALLLATAALEHARVVITGTHAAAATLGRLAPAHASKIRVVPHAVAETLLAPPTHEDRERARVAAGEGPYVLYVGNEMPHKNLAALLGALRTVRGVLAPEGAAVLAGVPPGIDRPWAREAARLGVQGLVRALGKVDTGTLRGLYAGAAAFVFPSLAEGFGLPPLEALAQGTPVLAADIAPLREVLGDAARYFDPAAADGAGPALARLLAEGRGGPEAEERRRAHARSYSWATSARATAACYAEAMRPE